MSTHFSSYRAAGLAAALLLAACSSSAHRPTPTTSASPKQPAQSPSAPVLPALTPAAAAEAPAQSAMLIRRAAVEVDVDDVARAVMRAHAVVVAVGGYVEREEHGDRNASVVLRVPEPTLEIALDSLAGTGKVTSRTVSTQNVTDQVIDVEARIRTLGASRDRLRELLSHANGVSDVITVEHELARVQAELESLQGRLQQLRSSSALAELYVGFHRTVVLGPLGKLFSAIGRGLGRLFVAG